MTRLVYNRASTMGVDNEMYRAIIIMLMYPPDGGSSRFDVIPRGAARAGVVSGLDESILGAPLDAILKIILSYGSHC